MKKTRHADPRFSRWPKTEEFENGEIRISAKILTAPRFYLVSKLLIRPLEFLWQLTFSLCVLEIVFVLMKQYDVFRLLPCSRMQFYLILFGLFQVWFWDKVKGNTLTRYLFGRRFIIRVTTEKLQFGGRLFTRTCLRDQRLMFSMEKFLKVEDVIYQSSMRLCLILGDANRIEVMEIFGNLAITKILHNANMALRLTDPDNRRPDIARSYQS